MGKLAKMFKKVGGSEILRQYLQAHVFLIAGIEVLLLGVSKKALEIVRLITDYKTLRRLRKKYRNEAEQICSEMQKSVEHVKPGKVWVCWLQGLEAAPDIVKVCYQSLKDHIKDREIVLLTSENIGSYVQLPDYIEEKHRKGLIPNAHYADLIRLEILIRYGGTWIDSTVLCTSDSIPSYLLNSDLFVYRILKPGLDGQSLSMSNWFITSCSNNPILEMTLKLLYAYWKKEDKLINYYIFHMFFEMAMDAFPEEWSNVVPCTSSTPHNLLLNLFVPYRKDYFEGIVSQSCFHKLSYKLSEEDKAKQDTIYRHIMETFSQGMN